MDERIAICEKIGCAVDSFDRMLIEADEKLTLDAQFPALCVDGMEPYKNHWHYPQYVSPTETPAGRGKKR